MCGKEVVFAKTNFDSITYNTIQYLHFVSVTS